MNTLEYIGFDVHKKSISFCVKAADGRLLEEGKLAARRKDLTAWAEARQAPWVGGMEATLFTGWIYDHLRPYAQELKVGHPLMMKARRTARGGGTEAATSLGSAENSGIGRAAAVAAHPEVRSGQREAQR